MKETQKHNSDTIEIVNQVQAKKIKSLLGSIIPHEGHTLYEFDKTNFKLRKATFERKNHVLRFNQDAGPDLKKEVIIKENCFYISSLNVKNAVHKIHKQLGVAYVVDATNE